MFYPDETLLQKVGQFSTDKKNNSMEFNEFLKMNAHIKNRTPLSHSGLVEAFK